MQTDTIDYDGVKYHLFCSDKYLYAHSIHGCYSARVGESFARSIVSDRFNGQLFGRHISSVSKKDLILRSSDRNIYVNLVSTPCADVVRQMIFETFSHIA